MDIPPQFSYFLIFLRCFEINSNAGNTQIRMLITHPAFRIQTVLQTGCAENVLADVKTAIKVESGKNGAGCQPIFVYFILVFLL